MALLFLHCFLPQSGFKNTISFHEACKNSIKRTDYPKCTLHELKYQH
ncbi:hypothetical protein HMPREF2531_00420 [Bacteroides intestinalis]|uniref:Uncharacterized protein n=2 Tax=Bacteroides TaxID=816 RepID=A0A139LU18_9BACE|nr:hypothetical protein BACCELL_05540 [Bacteroides cellulosilyticus DSM 14838]KXT54939.1 hypothetical protein HMPREF2531_00420 [Bacteroides intestinalis]